MARSSQTIAQKILANDRAMIAHGRARPPPTTRWRRSSRPRARSGAAWRRTLPCGASPASRSRGRIGSPRRYGRDRRRSAVTVCPLTLDFSADSANEPSQNVSGGPARSVRLPRRLRRDDRQVLRRPRGMKPPARSPVGVIRPRWPERPVQPVPPTRRPEPFLSTQRTGSFMLGPRCPIRPIYSRSLGT
jgi:hypothetical protein